MTITWYVEDGYAGSGQAPHYVDIDDEELAELDAGERTDLVEEYVKEAFRDTVSYYYDEPDWSELQIEDEEQP